MSHHIQINPGAPALRVSWQLLKVLDEFAEDFDIRYCFVPPTGRKKMVAALEALTPTEDEESAAIQELITRLRGRKEIELLYS